MEELRRPGGELASRPLHFFWMVDCSGSMYQFENDMRKALRDFQEALINSKEADEILIARADFADRISVGRYKKISEFATNYDASGMTALNDTIVEGVEKLDQYRSFLKQEGMRVKAVFAIFSDGEDTSSRHSVAEARQKIEYLNNEEIVTAFISFGGGATQSAKDLKFKNILDVSSSASELRKAFNCLSKSVIENSKSAVDNTDDFFGV